MFGRVIDYKVWDSADKYVDHYIKLIYDNSEVVRLMKAASAPKESIIELNDLDSALITRNYRYYDKWGNYWNNWIGKEVVVDL